MFKGIIIIFISLIIGLIGSRGLYEVVYDNENKILKYEKLINEGKATTAYLNSEHERIKLKKFDTMFTKYTYSVDSKEYEGIYFFGKKNIPESDTLTLYYLKEEPTFNAINIQGNLDIVKKQHREKRWLGLYIGFLVLSITLFIIAVFLIKKTKVKNVS